MKKIDQQLKFSKIYNLITEAHDTGEKHLNLKIQWAATIGPMLRQALKILDGMKGE